MQPSGRGQLALDILFTKGGLLPQARATSPGIAVVYVTGDSAGHWDREGVPNSVMLQRPFVNSDLIAALRALIN